MALYVTKLFTFHKQAHSYEKGYNCKIVLVNITSITNIGLVNTLTVIILMFAKAF